MVKDNDLDIKKMFEEIIKAFKKKGILKETIIDFFGCRCCWNSESYTIEQLAEKIVDEYTKELKRCPNRYFHRYRSYSDDAEFRTNDDTCGFCGTELVVVKDDKEE